MTLPEKYVRPHANELNAAPKTSLEKPKPAIALLLLLWHSEDKPSQVSYGIEGDEVLGIEEKHIQSIYSFASGVCDSSPTIEELREWIAVNPLLKDQMEPLKRAFEQVWRLARLTFQKGHTSQERTGNRRYPKRIEYSTNVDIINLAFESTESDYIRVLLKWVSDDIWSIGIGDVALNIEMRLNHLLECFMTSTLFPAKLKRDGSHWYTLSNLYRQVCDSSASVDICQGSAHSETRILGSSARAGMLPVVPSRGGSSYKTVRLADGVNADELLSFSSRAKTSADLFLSSISKETPEESSLQETEDYSSQDLSGLPFNLIVFGAPGTGKSHDLDIKAKEYFPSPEQRTRVTFHPEYTYSQFVGSYKPYVALDEDALKKVDSKESLADVYRNGKIKYCYEFGPFLETYIQALLHPDVNYVLIIEELNRANPAAAFGDVFQLLDRNDMGRSVYPVTTPDDMRGELWKRLYESSYLPGDSTLKRYSWDDATEAAKTLSLPPNMYIWATMNSADQGVFPMDTAFKRRWSFEYKDINHSHEVISTYDVELSGNGHVVNWDKLRRRINEILLSDCRVKEDKLLGPFFVAPEALEDPDEFATAFKDKVLLYLCEDAARLKPGLLFKGCKDCTTITYSYICGEFDSRGEEIFGLSLSKE